MDLISSKTTETINKALDGLMVRHQAISSNLANIDTPGYKPVRVAFENQLKAALQQEHSKSTAFKGHAGHNLEIAGHGFLMKQTNSKHLGYKPQTLQGIAPTTYKDSAITYRNDGNGVDVDVEMTNLAKNTMQYEALATLQRKNYTLLKDVIKGTQ